eukprot:GHVQ01022911.1.p1 GENE.GHVQ01022911.1~~GHVQ01022911.1.p1  ORF type:complete len:859 (-),score=157.60 GHVQ01022911.1:493-3045(-)
MSTKRKSEQPLSESADLPSSSTESVLVDDTISSHKPTKRAHIDNTTTTTSTTTTTDSCKDKQVSNGSFTLSVMDRRCINSVRCLSAELPQQANSGHPGAPMGCAPMAHALFGHVMNYSPLHPLWINRDRFILSNGHACALLYSMLHLCGYDITTQDLQNFRQIHSKTPGHPESFETPGVEVCTGPLGQGLANAVGMAIGVEHMASHFNQHGFDDLINHYVYAICGDGCLQEGVTGEASSLAGHLGLGKLIVLYDSNNITIDGSTALSFTEDVLKRYEAYGWHVQEVRNGDNDQLDESTTNTTTANTTTSSGSSTSDSTSAKGTTSGSTSDSTSGSTSNTSSSGSAGSRSGLYNLMECIAAAKNERNRPSLIKVNTTIGYGSLKAGSEKTHGAPLGSDDITQMRVKFGLDGLSGFQVSDDVRLFYKNRGEEGNRKAETWTRELDRYAEMYPQKGAELKRRLMIMRRVEEKGTMGGGEDEIKGKDMNNKVLVKYPTYNSTCPPDSTRSLSGKCLNAMCQAMPEIIGGSADLTGSNSSALAGTSDFQLQSRHGRYIRYGVREHAMAAISNGLAAYGTFKPFAATFLNFITYAWGAVRLSALGQLGVLYISTHDSIELGEDGPTHQPIETISLVRATPNITLLRPADGKEVVGSYRLWSLSSHTPVVMALCRSAVPHLEGTSEEGTMRGGYVVSNHTYRGKGNYSNDSSTTGSDTTSSGGKVRVVIAGSGSELHLCVKAAEMLTSQSLSDEGEDDDESSIEAHTVRVVSMPSWEMFDQQTEEYRESVVCQEGRRKGEVITVYVEAASTYGWDKYFDVHMGMKTFGKSAKKKDVMQHFGFTVEGVVGRVKEALKK